ncbi:MarR family winged helix-turn-helix transcriptional regulator [Rhodococcus tukisamuensis]|uniref:DNA-binding transcriptional regulator, MarR family n=1 Tax=Rhodococcus tukisamuensis TaxID=168276 RepID=A0A1G7E5N8_9NOCA|nr:MarR family transcriptional regulator [Rhodococcus tukisamuensis]SDE58695.1 DNA-binding transcriptional regulator, MarR family [Rhodococcus tukisamuensis]
MDATDEDFVDRVRDQWAGVYPDEDLSPVEVIGRIGRIGTQALARLDQMLAPSGVTRAEFDVLGALARGGRPLRASEVTAVTMVSGAATTKHADRLVTMGLVRRRPFERDGRVVLLELTEAGRAFVAEHFPRRLELDRQLLAGLDAVEREALSKLLRRISAVADR